MTLLHVRAHWTDSPPAGMPQVAPPPSWAGGYPGGPPTMPFAAPAGGGPAGPPDWPSPPTGPVKPQDRYHVWVPLVRAGDLDSSGWAAGVNWAGPPPQPWPSSSGLPANTLDEGYSQAAIGFQVARLRLFQNGPPGNEFTYTVIAPSGVQVGTITPAAPGWSLPITANVADGRGFWHVIIDRAPGSSVSRPALLGAPAGNPVNEPYVSPYGNLLEGILGIEFDGQEILVTPPTVVTGSVAVGPCDAAGNRGATDLTLTFTPPLAVSTAYTIVWTTGVAPPATQNGTVAATQLATLSRSIAYSPGTYFPSATVTLTSPGGFAVTTVVSFATGVAPGVVQVDACPPGACHDIAVESLPQYPCVHPGQSVTTTTTATFTPAAPAFIGTVDWQVRGPGGALLPLPVPIPTGPVLTYTFSQTGRYEITATIERPAGCVPRIVHDTEIVDVVACNCPSFVGGLTSSSPDGCTFAFSAQVSNPTAAALTFVWDFGSGPDPTAPSSPTVTHTYPPGTNGPQTVSLTVTSPGCSASIMKTVTVNCVAGGGCPQISGALVATSTGGCGFDFVATVTNPSGAGFAWNFGDGTTSTTTTPTASHTYTTTGSFTATLTVTSPNCPSATASTTVTCGGGGGGGGGIPACSVLLVLAIILLLLGAALVIVGVCISLPWLWIAGGIVGVVGLLLFIFWAIFCAALTPCPLMRTMHCLLFWIIAVVAPIIVLLTFLLGGLPCGFAALGAWGGWGTLYAWLGFVMRRVGCTPTC